MSKPTSCLRVLRKRTGVKHVFPYLYYIPLSLSLPLSMSLCLWSFLRLLFVSLFVFDLLLYSLQFFFVLPRLCHSLFSVVSISFTTSLCLFFLPLLCVSIFFLFYVCSCVYIHLFSVTLCPFVSVSLPDFSLSVSVGCRDSTI